MQYHAFLYSTCLNQEFKCSNDDLFDPFAFGNVATFRPLHVVSGWLGRHVAFFGKAYAQYAIADAVAWLAVPEWRAHPANSTPNSLYNRWHFHTAGCCAIVFDLIINS